MNDIVTYPRTKNFPALAIRVFFVAIGILLVNFTTSVAQVGNKIDSLKHATRSEDGITQYDALISLTRTLAATDDKKALEVAKEALAFAKELKATPQIIEAARICGQLHNRLDQSSEAIKILTSVLTLAKQEDNTSNYIIILHNLAIAYTFQAQYDKALQYNFEALALKRKENNPVDISYSLTGIGVVYYKMRNYKEALSYYKDALNLQRKAKDDYDIDRVLINIGLCYNQLNEYKEARTYFIEALDKCELKCHDQVLLDGHYGLGVSFFELEDYTKADIHFKQCYETAKKINNNRFVCESLLYLSKIDISREQPAEAYNKLVEAERISKTYGYKELLTKTYYAFSLVFDIQKDIYKSAYYLKQYIALKDSIYSEEVIKNISEAKSDYEQRENEEIIKANETTIIQQRRLYLSVIVIAILAGLLILVLLRANRITRKVNAKLYEAQNVIFEQNKQLENRNRELDKLVEKKTEELKLLNLSLKQVNKELDTFIHKTSEDIRAPLASLKGICAVALMDIKDEVTLEYLTKINLTAERLNSILSRLLAINRINHSKINLTEIDLRTLVDNVISLQKKKGLPKNLVVRKNIADNTVIQSDKELLGIVLENSIDNAIKVCNNSPREEHFIEINVAPNKNGRVSVRVINNGIEANESKAREFERMLFDSTFSNLEYANESQDLYFVKTAALKIGGKVDVTKTEEGHHELCVVL